MAPLLTFIGIKKLKIFRLQVLKNILLIIMAQFFI